MLEDVYLTEVDGIGGCTFAGQKASSLMVGTGVSTWCATKRGEICNVNVSKCSAAEVTVGPVILKNCRVEDSKATRHFASFYGTAFSNCSFHGNCGRVWIEDAAKLTMSFTHINDAVRQANHALYRELDIALDLSDAWFSDFELRGIPLNKVRTAPDRQIKCCYEKSSSFFASFTGDASSDSIRYLRMCVQTCEENHETEFLIASAKSGKSRQRFLEVQQFCETNGLLL